MSDYTLKNNTERIKSCIRKQDREQAKEFILARIEFMKQEPHYQDSYKQQDIKTAYSKDFNQDVIDFCIQKQDNELLKVMHRFFAINYNTCLNTIFEKHNPKINEPFLEFLYLYFANYAPSITPDINTINTVHCLNKIIEKTPEQYNLQLYVVLENVCQDFLLKERSRIGYTEPFSQLTSSIVALERKVMKHRTTKSLYDCTLLPSHSIVETLCFNYQGILYNDPFIFESYSKFHYITEKLIDISAKYDIPIGTICSNYFVGQESRCFKSRFINLIKKHNTSQTPFYDHFKYFFEHEDPLETGKQLKSKASNGNTQNRVQQIDESKKDPDKSVHYLFNFASNLFTITYNDLEFGSSTNYCFNCNETAFFQFEEGLINEFYRGFTIKADDNIVTLPYSIFDNGQIDDFRLKMQQMINNINSSSKQSKKSGSLSITEEQ